MPYKTSKYERHRQFLPEKCKNKTFRTVDLSHTDYSGEKFDVPGTKAIVCKTKREKKWKTQSILIPKKGNGGSRVNLTKKDKENMQKFDEIGDIVKMLNDARFKRLPDFTFEQWKSNPDKKFYPVQDPPKNDAIVAADYAVGTMKLNSYNNWAIIESQHHKLGTLEFESGMRKNFDNEMQNILHHLNERAKEREEQLSNIFNRVPEEKRSLWFQKRETGEIKPILKGRKVVSRMIDYYERDNPVEMK